MLNWLKRIEGLIFTLSSAEVSCGLCWAPEAQAPPRMLGPFLLYVMNLVHDFSAIKGFISRKGCKPLMQIMSFLILLFHILIWNDILILFSGISKRKKTSFDPLERLIFFLLKEALSKQLKYKRKIQFKREEIWSNRYYCESLSN